MAGWNKILDWEDDWLKENYLNYPSYVVLTDTYNKLFGKSYSVAAVKTHCLRVLNLRKPHAESNLRYTKEQKEWLKENYPLLGETETTRQFNEKFNMNKPIHSIVNHCCREGIKVNKQVANRNHSVFNTRAYETGGIKYLNDRQYIKLEDGSWIPRQRYVYEKTTGKKVPPKWHVIFLDGDYNNFNPDNLVAIPMKYNGLLSGHGLRSEDPEITKAGVLWCELYDALDINKDMLNRANRTMFECDLGLEE